MVLNRRLPSVFIAGYVAFIPAAVCFAQTQDALTARALYYNPGSDDVPKVKKRSAAQNTSPQATSSSTAGTDGLASHAGPPLVNASAMTPVAHLGVKYNLVLVDDKGVERAADPDSTFHAGDCLSLRVQSNHDGYLYVLQHGSTGKWDVLLPSTMMSEESNVIHARETAKIPANYCFAVDNTPGVEHVFVVLSRNPEDVYALNSAVRAQQSGGTISNEGGAGSAPPSPTQEMALLENGMQARDLTIKKISKPVETGEAANTVYVVNTSSNPSDRIVTEIPLKHE